VVGRALGFHVSGPGTGAAAKNVSGEASLADSTHGQDRKRLEANGNKKRSGEVGKACCMPSAGRKFKDQKLMVLRKKEIVKAISWLSEHG